MLGAIRRVPLPCDPLSLARALSDHAGLAVLASAPDHDARFSFVACDPIETTDDLVPESSTRAAGYDGAPCAPRWIGVVPYESMRAALERNTRSDARAEPRITKPRWHRYDAIARVDHRTGEVSIEADDARAADRLVASIARGLHAKRPARAFSLRALAASSGDAPRDHEARVATALDYIARGDVYQVNLARRLAFAFEGSPLDHFANLFGKSPSPYAVYWEMNDDVAIAGTSPELALEVVAATRRARTAPIKGTRPRGAHFEEDEALRAELESSDKERAELVMAVDLHRNDLGRVARFGSVRVLGAPRTLRSRTVFSRAREVVAFCNDAIDLSTIASAVLPCGSVTGAPKVRAMEIIAELEAHRRGLYTGAIGYVSRSGDLVLSMAIRTSICSRHDRVLEYFTGGGIVAGSDPRREVEETNWKALQLGGSDEHHG